MDNRKIPMRMCIVCKDMKPKRELIRIVRNAEGEYSLDTTGKANGRGAYLCNTLECVDKLFKTKALSRSFKENVPKEVYERIKEEYANNKD